MTRRTHEDAIKRFRALHAAGCFVLPNPWDVGSAVFLKHAGFDALATTSAGFAFSRGLADTVTGLSCEAVLAHTREIVSATSLPVSADFQAGYGDDAEAVAQSVSRCVHTGVAGLSIEDATGDATRPLYERAQAIERVAAAHAAIDATGLPVVLTARCEAWLVDDPEPTSTAIDRLVAFADAGADCLYAPGVRDPAIITSIVSAVAPKPVNVLLSSPDPLLNLSALEQLGVRRISVGSAFARVAWGAFMKAARSIRATGSFDSLADAAPFNTLDRMFSTE